MNWWVKPGSISGPAWDGKYKEWRVSWIQQWEDGREIKLHDYFVLHSFALKFIQQHLKKREKDERQGTSAHSRQD
jgi:hypothetical protein